MRNLRNYLDNRVIGPATPWECRASDLAADVDGGAGVIFVLFNDDDEVEDRDIVAPNSHHAKHAQRCYVDAS